MKEKVCDVCGKVIDKPFGRQKRHLGQCQNEINKSRNKNYYALNSKRLNAYTRAYYAANAERLKDEARTRRVINSVSIKKQRAEFRTANRQKLASNARKYYKANAEEINAKDRKRHALKAPRVNAKRRQDRVRQQNFQLWVYLSQSLEKQMKEAVTPVAKPDTIQPMVAQITQMLALLPATEVEAGKLSTEELRHILRNAPLAITSLLVIHAAVWRVLETRGEKMTEFLDNRNDIYRCVREIAHGRLAASAVCEFGTDTRLLDVVKQLPPKVQEQLAADPKVEFLDPKQSDNPGAKKPVSLHDMQEWQINQVVDRKRKEIRTPEQQAVYIRSFTPVTAPKKRGQVITRGRIAFDKDTNRLRIVNGPDADLEHAIELFKAIGYKVTKAA